MAKKVTMLLAAALLTACSESTTPKSTQPYISRIIHVSASRNTLVVGDSVDVSATATAADGAPFPLTTVEWKSSNVAIATVTTTGPLTATVRTISAGSVSISATVESRSGELGLTVKDPPPPPPQILPSLAFVWSREAGMTALTFPPGVGESHATDINDLGQVVGSVNIDHTWHAFVWTREAGMTDIGGLAGSVSSSATAINNAGQVVGTSTDASGNLHVFRWSPTEGMIALPMPPGTKHSYARDINSRGDVVGERTGQAGTSILFRWSQEKGTEDLSFFGSDFYGAATAIADNGDVVGYSGGGDLPDDVGRAVLWSANGTQRIIDACTEGFIAWDFTYVCHSSANAINGAGQIVVQWESATSVAVLSPTGSRQHIPGINGSYATFGVAINEAGEVAGYSYLEPWPWSVGRAFLWSPTGGITDLGALPGRLWSVARGINNRGQVVGSSN